PGTCAPAESRALLPALRRRRALSPRGAVCLQLLPKPGRSPALAPLTIGTRRRVHLARGAARTSRRRAADRGSSLAAWDLEIGGNRLRVLLPSARPPLGRGGEKTRGLPKCPPSLWDDSTGRTLPR